MEGQYSLIFVFVFDPLCAGKTYICIHIDCLYCIHTDTDVDVDNEKLDSAINARAI